MNCAGTKNPWLTGADDFIALFSNDLVVQIDCLLYSSLSGPPLTHKTHSSPCEYFKVSSREKHVLKVSFMQ